MAGYTREFYQASKPSQAYDPGAELRERQRIQRAINESPVVLAEKFKLEGNDASDNAGQMNDLSIAVNGMSSKIVPRVVFPSFGTYRYTAGLAFTREVYVDLGSAVLRYDGNGIAGLMGPAGLNAVDKTNRRYGVIGGTLLGGASMLAGFKFSTFLTAPFLFDTNFYEFGNANAYAIDFEGSNWDSWVNGAKYHTDSVSTGNRNWIICNSGTPDNGQSRLRVTNVLATEQGFGAGTCITFNGVNDVLHDFKIEGFGTAVQLGSHAIECTISQGYLETTKGTEAIKFGDSTGLDIGAAISGLVVDDLYLNAHNNDVYGTSANLIGPATTSARLQDCSVEHVRVIGLDPSRPLIRLNDLAGQTGNSARANKGFSILHTTGADIDDWGGEDGRFSPAAYNVRSGPIRTQRASITVTASTTSTETLTWDEAFSDANYTATVSLYEATGGLILVPGSSKAAAGVTVTVQNTTPVDLSGELDGIAIHD